METLCRWCACLAAPLAFVLGNMDAPAHSVAYSHVELSAAVQVSDR